LDLSFSEIQASDAISESETLQFIEPFSTSSTTTPVGGVPDLVTHGLNGWLVPVGDTAVLAGALTQAQDNEKLVSQRADAALQVIRDAHVWEKTGPIVTELYQSLASK
jgi:glycosyltransferase involved in cell wall biosynthesis